MTDNYIFGIRSVIEAIKSGKEIDRILIKKGLQGDIFAELSGLIKEFNIPTQFVPIEKIDKVTRKNHQGIVAFLSEITYSNIEEIVPKLFEDGKVPFILILDGITDVRNFGAICRTAECAGIDAVIIPSKGAAQINADAVKTSAGALNYLPVCRVNSLHSTIKFLKNSGIRIIAATEKAQELYYKSNFNDPIAIVLGSEEFGVSPDVLKISDYLVKIPVFGKISSLNVSVAASIIIYEAVKQSKND
jgi:23S rRNA (guanosine2251-2'-O)-methyltransferase